MSFFTGSISFFVNKTGVSSDLCGEKKRNNFIVFDHQTGIQCRDIMLTIFFQYNCFMVKWSYIQGARKVSFTACHLGKLQLACVSPKVISTSLQKIGEQD